MVGVSALAGRAETWDPHKAVEEKIDELRRLYLQLRSDLSAVERSCRERTSELRDELTTQLGEIWAAVNTLGTRIDGLEEEEARTDARGIFVIGAGILLAVTLTALIGRAIVRDWHRPEASS